MQFKFALLAVKDVEVSKRFYTDLFEQKVILDLGWNVAFSGGSAEFRLARRSSGRYCC
ncbi:MAG: hypothetical protein PHE70_07835 [Tepidanaerobacteraceae bacterium]|nr:hypothetical protein [Tepidanaerobacteraceae bacterium]